MFLSYDIQPVNVDEDSGTCTALTYMDDVQTDHWSIYGRDADGRATCVGDYTDFASARDIYIAITGNALVPAERAVLMGLPGVALRYKTVRDAIIAASKGLHHPAEVAIAKAMQASHAAGLGATLTAGTLDAALDEVIAMMKSPEGV